MRVNNNGYCFPTSLLSEIAEVFPQMEMPKTEELTVHQKECNACACLREDLDTLRGMPVNVDVIRLVHQDLTCLSTKTWQWILPHYLRYCLSNEGQESQMETEFLVYRLSPSDKFKEESISRFSFLDEKQIKCLLHFLDWCSAHHYWKLYFPDNLNKAKLFLCRLLEQSTK